MELDEFADLLRQDVESKALAPPAAELEPA